jgi:hypothetical protein
MDALLACALVLALVLLCLLLTKCGSAITPESVGFRAKMLSASSGRIVPFEEAYPGSHYNPALRRWIEKPLPQRCQECDLSLLIVPAYFVCSTCLRTLCERCEKESRHPQHNAFIKVRAALA